jgi:peroxin-4
VRSSRLRKEVRDLESSGHGRSADADTCEIVAFPTAESDLHTWTAWIHGPPDTPFASYRFQLKLIVPRDYPMHPPKAYFLTRIAHPNVHFKTGEICLDVRMHALLRCRHASS